MKLKSNNIRKIDISQINVTDNIRKEYKDIEQLARTIERDGQLQPIGVTEQENGTFNILYGFRRFHAHLLLVQEGKAFNQIEAKITTGDPAIIQLIENIHRDNLKPEELENALQTLIDSNMSQTEISERLNIRITRISDALAARKVRLKLEKSDIDTKDISTSALAQVRTLTDEKKTEVIKEAKKKGATVKAIKEEVKKVKQKNKEKKDNIQFIKVESVEPIDLSEEDILSKIGGEIVDEIEQQDEDNIEEKPYVFMSPKDFFNKYPEVRKILDDNNIILQCPHCEKEI